MNYKKWIAHGISAIGITLSIIALKPQDWANNLVSWKTPLLILTIIFLTILPSLVYNKTASNRYIMTFPNRNNSKHKDLLNKELLITKNITEIGIACDEISRLPYDFWKSFFIERDGKLRLMFLDPNGEYIKKREKEFRQIPNGRWSNTIQPNLDVILGNVNKVKIDHAQDASIRCDIGIYDLYPILNCIITDNYIFLHHYSHNIPGSEMPCFAIKKGGNGNSNEIYNFYVTLLNEYWDKCSNI